ncbi:molybdopterin oxidoreductase family protein [Hoeflea prorocentri]|uniref:Molybdopterin oxidoreductase family protein n=1 Tax=Hoeflea prorocentri TaxID=1922333 RepID=A0A9X3UJ52_9HYPH|nr:molybdopterin oxidoreductase family protein [Hoeflea prorocentri]MCY6380104.1 molybdopterin oxidoreductase family protein [Hoeflea prorocentri]MDA5397904.1 molybdopterin oxidoreductase family protein [Hoeflea prorocentri]
MSKEAQARTGYSACPHDCPSTCALEVELLDGNRVGRLRGASDNSYTAGVICAKVARYAERVHHPGRVLQPLLRKGTRGDGNWQDLSWDDALDHIAERFLTAERKWGSQTVWPYYYAGTMGLIQRDSIHKLRHAKKYSGQFDSICTNAAWSGFYFGAGTLAGPDPREMAKSDCVVIWGTNAVSTQVNVMTHAVRARKERGARIVVIDIYDNPTMAQADMKLILKPGTDGALACAVMHVLFRDGFADRAYLDRYSDDPVGLEVHLQSRGPEWAAQITGLAAEEIEAFAHLVGETKRSYFRLGYGFTRQRNGTVNMHAASCIATVTGAWQYEGGGAFHSNASVFGFDHSRIMGLSLRDPDVRHLDQSKIGRVLKGDEEALGGGPPVTAMLIQNTNPANVAPEQRKVIEGLMREDLFTVVHEQFMTETAELADVVLPATVFLEHDDVYRGGGHQHIMLGPKLIEPPEGPRPNLFVVNELAKRLGVTDPGMFEADALSLVDDLLQRSGHGDLEALRANKWIDCQPDFETSHFIKGFAWPDGKFRLRLSWHDAHAPNRPPRMMGPQGPYEQLPEFPDHCDLIENADAEHPFRLATSPARNFLNSTFAETQTSRKREGRPELMIGKADAERCGVSNGDLVTIGNPRGSVRLHARIVDGVKPGVLVSEGLWPNKAFVDGEGINVLTGADSIAPFGGAAFHDNHVWLRL